MVEISHDNHVGWVVGDPKYKLPAIPVILIACKNCGFIAQHAAGPLGVARYM
jgi:hypothetical protein